MTEEKQRQHDQDIGYLKRATEELTHELHKLREMFATHLTVVEKRFNLLLILLIVNAALNPELRSLVAAVVSLAR